MTGEGRSHGSITVINAMPCGIGATIGVGLNTSARFSEHGDARVVRINNDVSEDTNMARICVRRAYERAGIEEDFSMDPVDLIRLGVECAREAKVTVTGSFDDACGCGLGGLVMTDNRRDEIIDRADIGDYDVVIHVPAFKIRKTGLPLDRLHEVAPLIQRAIDITMSDPFAAMTMNGRIISEASGVDNSVAERALDMGALGAGMSGSGPAVAIVVAEGDGKRFAEDMGMTSEETILTVTRCGE